MALIPVPEEPLRIIWQNTVVDIEPTSRYGIPGDTPDTASINTTLVLEKPHAGPVTFLAPGHYEEEVSARQLGEAQGTRAEAIPRGHPEFEEIKARLEEIGGQLEASQEEVRRLLSKVKQFHRFTLEVAEGNRVLRYFARLPVIREPEKTYKFSQLVPVEFARLAPGGDFSVVVLLPRPAEGYDDGPGYEVRLLDWSKAANPQVFGHGGTPALAQRTAVAWYWRKDPRLDTVWEYVPP